MGHNTPAYIHTVTEAMRVALADREEHIGDPAYHQPPLDRLLSDAYAEEVAARIRRGLRCRPMRAPGEPRDTTTISVVDRDGMVASLTHTLGVPSGVIPPGTGIMLNGAMNWYDPRPGRPGSIAPGKKRFSSMAPTIVFEGQRPVVTLGAPGGAWIGVALIQVLLNVLEFGMGMQEAVLAPRFSATTPAIDISNRIPHAVQRELERMGHQVKRAFHSYPFAAPHGIAMWDGALEGGAELWLNTGSAVRTDPGGRRLTLLAGELRMDTGAAPAPWEVRTRQARFTATQARFLLRQIEDATLLDMQRGDLRIAPVRGAESRTEPGGRYRVTDWDARREPAPPFDAESWADGVLTVRGMRLADFLQELSRYQRGWISCDPAVADLRVSGVFLLDDLPGALNTLSRALPTRIERYAGLWTRVLPA